MIEAGVENLQLRGLFGRAGDGVSSGPRVEIYQFDCRLAAPALAEMQAVLDGGELEAIGRFRQATQRQRSTAVRGALRWVLGARLQMRPQDVPLFRDDAGRPRLRAFPGLQGLSISCSSSDTTGIVAVGTGTEVGIDIEHLSARRFPDAVAGTLLHAREQVVFELLPRAARAAWLAEAWVCKEATLKALGVGLAVDPRTVELERHNATVSGEVGEFRVAGYPRLKGWLYRSGASTIALAASAPSVRLRRLHLTLDAPGVEPRSGRIQQCVAVLAGSAS